MYRHRKIGSAASGVSTAALALCLTFLAGPLHAQELPGAEQQAPARLPEPSTFSPFSISADSPELLIRDETGTPLRLELRQPFSLQQFGQAVLGQTSTGRSSSSGMNYRVANGLSLSGGVSLAETTDFQSLGSIHCENGVMNAVSYRASNCYFIDDTNRSTAGAAVLGANFRANDRVQASLNLFRERRTTTSTMGNAPFMGSGSALADPLSLGINPGMNSGNRLLGGLDPLIAGPGFSSAERTGVDVEFQVGFSTDQAGDMVLGLQLTRVLDSGLEGVFYASPGARNWTIAEPYDAARLSLDWNRGAFSGGLDSYYRSPISFIDRSELDSQATFDVHFSWRAPWNASLSVGASNVLGAGTPQDNSTPESNLIDPLESIYGRIPYVRYKQDL